MKEESKKRWLVKDREGRVRGPYFTDDILQKISRGEFSGEEQIALYPSTDWLPISNNAEFYDRLLDILQGEHNRVEDDVRAPSASLTQDEDFPDDFVHRAPKSRAESVKVTRIKTESQSSDKKNKQESLNPPGQDIELKKAKKVVKTVKLKKTSLPFFSIIFVLGVAAYVLLSDTPTTDARTHLLMIKNGMPAMSDDIATAKIQRAIVEFVKDNYENYTTAQAELVQVAEGQPKNAGVLALLCLAYYELWPYSYQDSADSRAISIATQMTSRVDPAGIEAATCRVVDLLLRGRYVEAKGVTEMILDVHGGGAKPPIAFYYFKAILLEVAKDWPSAASYAQSAQQLWPQWLRVYAMDAALSARAGKYAEAANKYRNILKINPQHTVAQIELGVIEYQHLKNTQVGQQYLAAAFSRQPKAPREVLVRGYLALSEAALAEQNSKQALVYAQNAYGLNSANARAKEIIVNLGGEKKLRETKILDIQLVYEGDQLVREGDCRAAQAHYKAAFEINKKNAVAAFKAAECLWGLSLSTEAIDWLNRAIQADANYIEAYVLLADYFTQRFNYAAAGKILSKARSQSPGNYKVFRGFALVEFRRNSLQPAVNYAEKAIQLYEADVESYIILGRAQIGLREFPKAFETASKAIELDMNNRQAQILYAESLAMSRGITTGLDYLNRMVTTYPTIAEYRLALGLLYAKDQSYTTAEQIFRQVTQIDDKSQKAFLELGKVLQLQKRYDDAVQAYFKAAQLDPSDVEPLFYAGILYLDAKKPGEARQQFQRVLRVNKDYPLVNFYIGRAALQLDSPGEALEQASIEKSKNPNLADPYLLAAEAYSELKQYSQCAGEYQQAVRLRPQGADIYIKMARCYRMASNLDAAVSMINQASLQESGNPEVWKEQGSIYEMRQESIKAIEAYQQYLVLAPNALDRDQILLRINALSR